MIELWVRLILKRSFITLRGGNFFDIIIYDYKEYTMMRAPLRYVKVKERKLGRQYALGLAWKTDGVIEIDPRLTDRRRFTVLLHEAMHIASPEMSESEVNRISAFAARILWADGYRRAKK